jgi:hypothetical protein
MELRTLAEHWLWKRGEYGGEDAFALSAGIGRANGCLRQAQSYLRWRKCGRPCSADHCV